jgi:hypothetical protein
MIALAQDCLLFQLANGEKVPFSASMISVELVGETSCWFDPEVARQAAKAVFHYFKNDLGRQSVTADEFARAMEKVLRGFKFADPGGSHKGAGARIVESDLSRLARDSGGGCELLFFPNLRTELRQHLRQNPKFLRFCGLRACVKQIAGAKRWTSRCRDLEEQIVNFLRECAGADSGQPDLTFVVE